MNTRKALKVLSKGEITYTDRMTSGLYGDGQRFVDMYDAREQAILAQKGTDSVPLPFLESIKRKVAKIVESPNESLPIVTRFDLYSGIRKLAERAPTDAGLKRLSAQLERAWRAEPLGALTYGDVNGLVHVYRDQFPTSKAADAVEAECSRVGMHKLPVAKLARIASNIKSQADYDSAVEANGYAGNRQEQVRARTMLRELVAMKGGTVDAAVEQTDDRDIGTRVADRINKDVSAAKNAGYQEALAVLDKVGTLTDSMIGMLDKAAAELGADGIVSSSEKAAGLSEALEQWKGLLADVRGEATLGAGHDADVYQSKMGSFDNLAADAASLAVEVDGELSDSLFGFARVLHIASKKIAQLMPPELELGDHEEAPAAPGEPGLGAPEQHDMAPTQEMTPEMVDSGADIINDIQEVAEEVVTEAPPEAQSYIEHEMAEGHTAPPGTPTWGAEEVLLEGHTAPPPSEQWLQEEMEEIGQAAPDMAVDMGPPMSDLPKSMAANQVHGQRDLLTERERNEQVRQRHLTTRTPDHQPDMQTLLDMGYSPQEAKQKALLALVDPTNPAFDDIMVSRAAAKGKGIPLPDGKIKEQPNAKNALDSVPSNGAKALKAAEIEEAILDGKTVRSANGNIRILIGDNDEVELWDRTAGRSADLADIEVVIADFINMANYETKNKKKVARPVETITVVDVPCESCANISQFELVASRDNQYACECGHLIEAAGVLDLVEAGLLRTAKVAQAVQPMAQPPMPPPLAPAAQPVAPGGTTNEGLTEDVKLPLEDVVKSAFTNYKARGLSFMEAMDTFRKEHKELIETAWTKEADAIVLAIAGHLYTSAQTMAPAMATSSMPGAVASKAAQKVLEPAVRKRMKDLVSLPAKPLGKDTSQDDGIPSPGTIKSQPNKNPQGEFSSKDMDGNNGEWSDPGTAASSPSKGKFPKKDLGPDSEGDDPFPAPSLGAKPSISRK